MHRISRKNPLSGIIQHFFIIRPDNRISLIQRGIRLKFDIIKSFIFSHTNILKISMHIYDAIMHYLIHCRQITIFFPVGFFFRRHFLGIWLDIRFEEIAFSDIRCYILPGCLMIFGNFTIRHS